MIYTNMKKLLFLFFISTITLNHTADASIWSACSNLFKGIRKKAVEGAYKKGFTTSMKTAGSLTDRAVELANKWPNNIKIVENVTMKFTSDVVSGQAQKKMLIISLDGLSSGQESKLLKEYIDYMSHNTLSFPLNEGAGHLHTRLGKMDLDFMRSLSQNEYRWPSSERLETFMELSEQEFKNVRQYVENIDLSTNVVGSNFQMAGVKSEIPGASLANNKPTSGGHNCTSWIGLAPIGENGQSLRSIAGTSHEYHTNPGWWTAYLQTKTSSEKVPIVAYITRKNLNEAIAKAEQESFSWNYSLH